MNVVVLPIAISLISVFNRYSYYAILFSLIVEIHKYAPRMHSRTPMIVGSLWCCSARPTYRTRSLSLYRSDKAFGYALGIDVVPEAIRHERVECAEDMESGSSNGLCLSFVSTEVCGRERGHA